MSVSPDKEEEGIECKVVLVGESAVGKTSIINYFINNQFSGVLMSTPAPGSCYSNKTIHLNKENKTINLKIWDTAGQEKYRSAIKTTYKDADACVFVFDITNLHSFEEVKNYWVNEIKSNAPEEIILAMAGNKSDLYQYEEVKSSEVKKFAKEINAIYKSTSAKEGKGIEDLFTLIAKHFVLPKEELIDNMSKSEKKKLKRERLNSFKIDNEESKNEEVVSSGCCF